MQKPEAIMANAYSRDHEAELPSALRQAVARRQQLLGAPYRLFYREPLHVESACGVWVTAKDGRRYLDAYNNVQSVGHSHPAVLAAMTEQAARLTTHTRYVDDVILDYAEQLLALFPAPLQRVVFTCSGSEANDLAIRVAKSFTGGEGLILTSHAYHGVTEAVAAISPSLGDGVPLAPMARLVDPPVENDDGRAFGARVALAVDDLARAGVRPAALIVDTIFSSDGVLPHGSLAPAVEAVRSAGGLFIADEVQPGFGRTGEAMWGFLSRGVTPDIATLGKPMGNGFPMAGLVARADILESFAARSRYFNTFGGSPLAGAVGSAVLKVISDEKLMENAAATGALLLEGLTELGRRHRRIAEVRGKGLFVGVEIQHPESGRPDARGAETIVDLMRRNGVLISASGPRGNVLKIRPPLVFDAGHAEMLIERADRAFSSIG